MFKKISILVVTALLLAACDALGTPPAPTAKSSDPVGDAYLTATSVSANATASSIIAALTPTAEVKLIIGETETPTAEPTATPMATAAGNCQDGAPTGLPKNKIDRTPIGDGQYLTVQEISVKPGLGFTGFDRWAQVTGALSNTHQVFNLDVETLNEKRYCGTTEAVKAYLSDPSTHIWAMRQSAADGGGNIPPVGEIPVVFINPTTGEITFLVAPTAATAPTLATIKQHIEVVALSGNLAPTSMPLSVSVATAAPAAAGCPPATEDNLDPWEAKDRQVSGPAIVNFGFPREGDTLYRTNVLTGVTATFLAAAGKAWKFNPGCSEAEIQRQLTANAGGITVISLDQLVAQGKARRTP